MKKLSTYLLCFVLFTSAVSAQTSGKAQEENKAYTGAKATKSEYHAIYQLDTNDPKIIGKAFRNINNALNDSRLTGKLKIELITFAGGTEVCVKGSAYENDLKELVEKGVIVAQCGNSLKERKIDVSQIYDFMAVVPSANGELIIRAGEGWVIIKP
ncbi:MAG: DsrE family protein [Bacteroidota bacterium]